MATFASVHYALQKEDRANPSRLSTPNVASGRVEFAYIPYALAGTEAANDIINLCVLPAGAVPIVPLCHVTCSADPGTTLTLDVCTAGDPDGLADGIVLSSGGQVAFTNTAIPAGVAATALVEDSGFPGNAAVYATVASANTLTAAVVLYFCIAFKRNRG